MGEQQLSELGTAPAVDLLDAAHRLASPPTPDCRNLLDDARDVANRILLNDDPAERVLQLVRLTHSQEYGRCVTETAAATVSTYLVRTASLSSVPIYAEQLSRFLFRMRTHFVL